jgi:hypothetical protein
MRPIEGSLRPGRVESERRALRQDYSRLRETAECVGQRSGLRDWALDYLRDRFTAYLDEQTSEHGLAVAGLIRWPCC